MAIYGVRNKYSDCDCATIQIKKMKDKEKQDKKAADLIPILISNRSIAYGDDYYVHLLWEE